MIYIGDPSKIGQPMLQLGAPSHWTPSSSVGTSAIDAAFNCVPLTEKSVWPTLKLLSTRLL